MRDKDSFDLKPTTPIAPITATASGTKNDKSTTSFVEDTISSGVLNLKDDTSISVFTLASDKSQALVTSLPSKDDKHDTITVTSSSRNDKASSKDDKDKKITVTASHQTDESSFKDNKTSSKDDKDDKNIATSSFQNDKTIIKDDKLTFKDDKTSTKYDKDDKASSINAGALSKDHVTSTSAASPTDKDLKWSLEDATKATGKSEILVILSTGQASSTYNKDRGVVTSSTLASIRTNGLDKTVSSSSFKSTDKNAEVPDKDKSLGLMEIVYSVTLPATALSASISSEGNARPISITSNGSQGVIPHPSSYAAYLSRSSPSTVISQSESKTDFPGYQIVPSPTHGRGPQNLTGSATPVYTPAMLGNAYGGGFITTPSIYVTKLPSPSKDLEGVPPGYRSDTKLQVSTSGSGGNSSFATKPDKLVTPSTAYLIQLSHSEPTSIVGPAVRYVTKEIFVTTTYCPVTTISGRAVTLSSITLTRTFSTFSRITVTQTTGSLISQSPHVTPLVHLSSPFTKEIGSLKLLLHIPSAPFSNSTALDALKSTQLGAFKPESFTTVIFSSPFGQIDVPKTSSLHVKPESTTQATESTTLPANSSTPSLGPFKSEVELGRASYTGSESQVPSSPTFIQALSGSTAVTPATAQEIKLEASISTVSSKPEVLTSLGTSVIQNYTEATVVASLVSEFSSLLDTSITTKFAASTNAALLGSKLSSLLALITASTPTANAYTTSPGSEKSAFKSSFAETKATEAGGTPSLQPGQASPVSTPELSNLAKGSLYSESTFHSSILGIGVPTGVANGTLLNSELSLALEVLQPSQTSEAIAVASLVSKLSALLSLSSTQPIGNLSNFNAATPTSNNLSPVLSTSSIVNTGKAVVISSTAPFQFSSTAPSEEAGSASGLATIITAFTGPTLGTTINQPSFIQLVSSNGSVYGGSLSQGVETVPSIAKPFDTSSGFLNPNAVSPTAGSTTIAIGQTQTSLSLELIPGSPALEVATLQATASSQGTTSPAPGVGSGTPKISGASGSSLTAPSSYESTASTKATKAEETQPSVVSSSIASQTAGQNEALNGEASAQPPISILNSVFTPTLAGALEASGTHQTPIEATGSFQQVTSGGTPLASQVLTSAITAFNNAQTAVPNDTGKATTAISSSLTISNIAQGTPSITTVPISGSNKYTPSSENTIETPQKSFNASPLVGGFIPSGGAQTAEALTSRIASNAVPATLSSPGPNRALGFPISSSTPGLPSESSVSSGKFGQSGAPSVQAENLFSLGPVTLSEASEGAGGSTSPTTSPSYATPTTSIGAPVGALSTAETFGVPTTVVELTSPAGAPQFSGAPASVSTGHIVNGHGAGNNTVSVILSPTTALPFFGLGNKLHVGWGLGLTALLTVIIAW